MHPPRLGILFALPLLIALAGASPSFAQRRVFTNEDFPSAPPPAPAPAPAAKAAAAAPEAGAPAGTPEGAAAQPAAPDAAQEGEGTPQGLNMAQFLQGTLRRYQTEFSMMLDQEVDATRQERWRTMLELITQLMTYNQIYIGELQLEEQQKKAEAQAQGGAQ